MNQRGNVPLAADAPRTGRHTGGTGIFSSAAIVAILVALVAVVRTTAADGPETVAGLLVAEPRRALVIATAWALYLVPPALYRRRRHLLNARSN